MSPPPAPLAHLPSELYAAILDAVDPPAAAQHATAALAIALPRSPVPRTHLFTYVHLRSAERIKLFARFLRSAHHDSGDTAAYADNDTAHADTDIAHTAHPHPGNEVSRIRRIAIQAWAPDVDADIVVNALRALAPRLERLTLFAGPSFAPEHVQEIVEWPMLELRFLSIRFRPYVKKAAYYQFLKGAYFDSTLHALASSPRRALTTLSIVQDPLEAAHAPTTFAQPIVFFQLDALGALVRARTLGTSLTALRVRLPHRDVAAALAGPPRLPQSSLPLLPALRLLDLSTSRVRAAEVVMLLERFPRLDRLVLDACGVVHGGGELASEEWRAFGRALALAEHQRMRAKEKSIKEYRERLVAAANAAVAEAPRVRERRAKKGRKGLATATISLRDTGGSGGGEGASSSSSTVPPPEVLEHDRDQPPARLDRIRVLPPAPTLRALAVTPAAHVPASAHSAIGEAFAQGWAEGIATLGAVRARLRASAVSGTARVVRFARPWEEEEGRRVGALGSVLDDLVDVEVGDWEEIAGAPDGAPMLCLAGPEREGKHAEGCPHESGWEAFGDDL